MKTRTVSWLGKATAFPICLALIFLLGNLGGAEAGAVEYLADELDCVKLAGRFMGYLVKGELERGFSVIKPYFPVGPRVFEGLKQRTEAQLTGNGSNFGAILGYRFIREDKVGDFLTRYVFVLKHELSLTRWEFVFYKPSTGWLLNSLYWDDQAKKLFSCGKE